MFKVTSLNNGSPGINSESPRYKYLFGKHNFEEKYTIANLLVIIKFTHPPIYIAYSPSRKQKLPPLLF